MPPPGAPHTDFWLADPNNVQARRRLFGVDNDVPITDVQWVGPNTFFMRLGGGVSRAMITPDTATLTAIANTGGVVNYAVIDAGQSIIAVDGTPSVQRLPVPDGAVTLAGAIPLSTIGHTLDVSCGVNVCVVLTTDGSPTHWDLWRLDLASGNVSPLRTFTHAIIAAKVSPQSGLVVTLEGDSNLYLLDLVVK